MSVPRQGPDQVGDHEYEVDGSDDWDIRPPSTATSRARFADRCEPLPGWEPPRYAPSNKKPLPAGDEPEDNEDEEEGNMTDNPTKPKYTQMFADELERRFRGRLHGSNYFLDQSKLSAARTEAILAGDAPDPAEHKKICKALPRMRNYGNLLFEFAHKRQAEEPAHLPKPVAVADPDPVLSSAEPAPRSRSFVRVHPIAEGFASDLVEWIKSTNLTQRNFYESIGMHVATYYRMLASNSVSQEVWDVMQQKYPLMTAAVAKPTIVNPRKDAPGVERPTTSANSDDAELARLYAEENQQLKIRCEAAEKELAACSKKLAAGVLEAQTLRKRLSTAESIHRDLQGEHEHQRQRTEKSEQEFQKLSARTHVLQQQVITLQQQLDARNTSPAALDSASIKETLVAIARLLHEGLLDNSGELVLQMVVKKLGL